MEHGHKVAGGDRLGKTIIFARNHDHAALIEERFNHHYPEHCGHFARVIDNQATYPQSLIDDFSVKDKAPHIAISVDMLDTGIDVPEVVNLVFFKPVYSRIKFWQMIGRGTRLCENLYGPGEDKRDFRIFDFCGNFDFFKENPQGIEGGGSASLSTPLFRTRVQLAVHLQNSARSGDDDGETVLQQKLVSHLRQEVQGMNPENFIVRMRLEAVERFQKEASWVTLSDEDAETLSHVIADLPSAVATDDLASRLFDLTALRMQLALTTGDANTFEKGRQRVVEIASMLEEKANVPDVREQLAYLVAIQEMTSGKA